MQPHYRMAEWIHKQLGDQYRETADDVYDVILNNITSPRDFVEDVRALALEYESRRRNGA